MVVVDVGHLGEDLYQDFLYSPFNQRHQIISIRTFKGEEKFGAALDTSETFNGLLYSKIMNALVKDGSLRYPGGKLGNIWQHLNLELWASQKPQDSHLVYLLRLIVDRGCV